MKKTAVLIYDQFCNFEISVALEILALNNRGIDVFAKTDDVVLSEDGLNVLPDKTIYDLTIEDYDSLLLPGAADIRSAVEDDAIIDFVKHFEKKIIGAMSIAPILLVKAGMLRGKAFMIGADKEDLLEENYREDDLKLMMDWTDCITDPPEDGYVISENILTSVSFNFIKFGIQFCKMLGMDISPKSFGL